MNNLLLNSEYKSFTNKYNPQPIISLKLINIPDLSKNMSLDQQNNNTTCRPHANHNLTENETFC